MPVKLSPLVHIEIVVRDAEEAYQFLHRAFGAQKVEEEMAAIASDCWMNGESVKVVHVGLGGVVLQFVEPLMEGTLWSDFLNTKGPGIHNLTFIVDNLDETVKVLEREGAPVLLYQTPLFDLEKMAEMMRSASPDGESAAPKKFECKMIGGEDKVGFRFEMLELG